RVLRLPPRIHSLKELKDDRHIHESSSYRDRLGVGIADSRKSNVSSKGATNSLRGLHPSLRCDYRKSGGVTARRNFNAGATSHDCNRTNDKRHKVYNRRDARQPLTALSPETPTGPFPETERAESVSNERRLPVTRNVERRLTSSKLQRMQPRRVTTAKRGLC